MMNNRYELVKKCLEKLDSISIVPANIWDYEYKKVNFGLNLQK